MRVVNLRRVYLNEEKLLGGKGNAKSENCRGASSGVFLSHVASGFRPV